MSINTALIPIVVTRDKSDEWFIPGGLATDMTYILIVNAILSPIINFVSPMHQLKRLKRTCVRRASKKGVLIMNQMDVNVLYEGPQIDLAVRYANVIKTLIVTFFYAPLIPIGLPISFFGLLFEYVVTKYMLLRVYSRPKENNAALALEMNEWFKWIALAHGLGTIIFFHNFTDSTTYLADLLFAICVIYLVLPVNSIMGCCYKNSAAGVLNRLLQENDKLNDYYEQYPKFYTDYERENPISRSEG